MISAGIDIGSRTVKVVVLNDGQSIAVRKKENSFDPLSVCRDLLSGLSFDVITATGYGRHLFSEHFGCEVISEIKACSLGARARIASCRTILDIGGQDIKVISLDESGRMCKFEMNDKCSAGTGRFLEIMAMALGCTMTELDRVALGASTAERINSMCTVFAESEVISLLARGAAREQTALGIYQSIIGRAKSMLHRVPLEDDLVFIGGVALNACLVQLLEKALDRSVSVPDDPLSVGAYGCALHGANSRG